MKFIVLFFAAVAVATADEASVKQKRDILVETSVPYYAPPAVGYAHTYAAPARTLAYSAPAVAYSAPAVAYSAPAVAYSAPAVAYSAPAVAYKASPPYDDGKYFPGKYETPTFSPYYV